MEYQLYFNNIDELEVVLSMRLDQYLWAVRLFKTRSLATKACNADQVRLNGVVTKPAKIVAEGHEIAIRVNPIWRTFKVLDLPRSRVGAKLVSEFLIETTPEEDLKQLEQHRLIQRQNRQLGFIGRPTKKDRRDWGKLWGD